MATGDLIVYTSADSVLQIAAHEDVVPLAELYAACAAAREIMTGEHAVGRVIARPFRGEPGAFERTEGRRDIALDPPARSYLRGAAGGRACRSTRSARSARCSTASASTSSTRARPTRPRSPPPRELIDDLDGGFVFANLVETDQVFGHRNDVRGLPRRAAGDRRRGRGVARAPGPRARPARPHRRPRRRPDAPGHRPHARARAAARPLRRPRRRAATTGRSPTSAPRSCAGSPAASAALPGDPFVP